MLRNPGSAAVRIGDTGSNCKCLTCSVGVDVLEPGESAPWRIALDPCGDYLGEVRRQAWVTSDAAPASLLRVSVRYRVVRALFAEPASVALGLIGADMIVEEVRIATVSNEPVRLLGVACDDPVVEVELLEDEATAAQPARLRVRLQGPVPEGRFSGRVAVHLASQDPAVVSIPVFGESFAGLRCDRRAASFEAVRLGHAATRELRFACDEGVGVVAVRTSNDAVSVKSVERTDGRITVQLRSDPRLPLGRFDGALILEVSRERNRIVRLPYRGQVVLDDGRPAGSPAHADSEPPQGSPPGP